MDSLGCVVLVGGGHHQPRFSGPFLTPPAYFHSRHCGRLLCHKCSTKEIPIIKFDLNKPVRVCNICFDVLTLGGVS